MAHHKTKKKQPANIVNLFYVSNEEDSWTFNRLSLDGRNTTVSKKGTLELFFDIKDFDVFYDDEGLPDAVGLVCQSGSDEFVDLTYNLYSKDLNSLVKLTDIETQGMRTLTGGKLRVTKSLFQDNVWIGPATLVFSRITRTKKED